ncbi:hypothetical protein E4U60_006589 [Claviceps pazoutovae]|uniref:CFEM domain-containing protein n=1 Tax=Claviceps pazoutovae TaxID=1649127 RepID=A0A9P7MFK3_9HYPO|nr:hypothetical protein E4U60_006589 [Claviceps pazoutovae]
MKASIAFLLAACTSTIMGMGIISIITECARDCLLDSVNIATNCKLKDYECACDNAEEIQNDGQNCVIQACGKWKSLHEVVPSLKEFCEEARRPIDKPVTGVYPSATGGTRG